MQEEEPRRIAETITRLKVPDPQNVTSSQLDLVTVIASAHTNATIAEITHIGAIPTLSYEYANSKCPIPPLTFNNSQKIMKFNTGLVVIRPGRNPSSNKYPIPEGSIIYHAPGFYTRIFESTVKQILTVNDSESQKQVNGGFMAWTQYYDIPDNLTLIGGSEYH
jgi:hypothetical protein